MSKLSMRVNDIYEMLRGGPIPEFSPIRSTFVDVRDVAELVLKRVEKDLEDQVQPAQERYLVVGQQAVSPQLMVDVLRDGFPEQRDKMQQGNRGEKYPNMTWRFDAAKASNLLGRDWISFQKSVVESAQVFIEAGVL
jgi:nucleoside-diphosphate-sugar epimerase